MSLAFEVTEVSTVSSALIQLKRFCSVAEGSARPKQGTGIWNIDVLTPHHRMYKI
jgi:hypothetical protein